MIRSLRLVSFKNFADERLQLGPFSVIVGANASGKSNIRDAFRFLHGIGRGYRLAEILGGKYGAGAQLEWAPMRGAMNEIVRFGADGFGMEVEVRLEDGGEATYRAAVSPSGDPQAGFRMTQEELWVGTVVYTTHPDLPDPVATEAASDRIAVRLAKTGGQRKYGSRVEMDPGRPILPQIAERARAPRLHRYHAGAVLDVFSGMRFLDLVPERMREASFPGNHVLGDHGENLATVLREMCRNESRRDTLTEWIRELTPMDVEDLEFPTDPATGKIRLVLRERGGRRVSADSASDGTLRFLALLASLLSNTRQAIYVLEEVDNGIHPARLRLLIDLIENRTESQEVQAITTTHSPTMLSMIGDQAFQTAALVCRLPEAPHAVIRQLKDLPNAAKLRESQTLGSLLASGWMEDAIAFTEPEEQLASATA